MPNETPNTKPLEELKSEALLEYKKIARETNSFNSFIVECINKFQPEPEGEKGKEELSCNGCIDIPYCSMSKHVHGCNQKTVQKPAHTDHIAEHGEMVQEPAQRTADRKTLEDLMLPIWIGGIDSQLERGISFEESLHKDGSSTEPSRMTVKDVVDTLEQMIGEYRRSALPTEAKKIMQTTDEYYSKQ